MINVDVSIKQRTILWSDGNKKSVFSGIDYDDKGKLLIEYAQETTSKTSKNSKKKRIKRKA